MRHALAAFESQVLDGESAFERFHYRGDSSAMSVSAQRGWALFSGRARCVSCHEVAAHAPALFTDHGFHGLPTGRRGGGTPLSDLVDRFMTKKAMGMPLDAILLSDDAMSSLGRFAVTENPAQIGTFKTPSLRNVALTAPYMHDGSVRTLQEAVDVEIYYRGTQDGHPLILTDSDKGDLVAFLHSLTSFQPPH